MKPQDISKTRPKLSVIAPLTSSIVWCYIFFNFLLGYALWMQQGSRTLVIYTVITPPIFWAVVFIIISLVLLYGEYRNNWEVIRITFIIALLVKAIFAYALLYVAYKMGFQSQVGVLGLWGLATSTQAATIIHFPHAQNLYKELGDAK